MTINANGCSRTFRVFSLAGAFLGHVGKAEQTIETKESLIGCRLPGFFCVLINCSHTASIRHELPTTLGFALVFRVSQGSQSTDTQRVGLWLSKPFRPMLF